MTAISQGQVMMRVIKTRENTIYVNVNLQYVSVSLVQYP